MKRSRVSRLMLIVALTLGCLATWSVTTPRLINGNALIGGHQDVTGCPCTGTSTNQMCSFVKDDTDNPAYCGSTFTGCNVGGTSSEECSCLTSEKSCSGTSVHCNVCDAKCA